MKLSVLQVDVFSLRFLVDIFCNLGDMLNVGGDADAAVEARIIKGWNNCRQLVPLFTNKDVSIIMRGKLCTSCVHSCMLHGSETWPVKTEETARVDTSAG